MEEGLHVRKREKMKGFGLATSLAKGGNGLSSWTCRKCLSNTRTTRIGSQVRGYGARHGSGHTYGHGATPRRKGRVLAAAAVGGVGASVLALGDDVKHAYEAAERTGRVVSTLAVCINE